MHRSLLALAGALFAWPVAAADLDQSFGGLAPMPRTEIRVGGYIHDPLSPERGHVDINGEFLFDLWGAQALVPRLHVGATLDTGHKTSNLYAGFTWTLDVTSAVFLEAALGGAINDGKTGAFAPPGYNSIGCNASFHEAASVGFRLTREWSVLGTVEHFSNAGLCVANRGLTNFGLRVAYRF